MNEVHDDVLFDAGASVRAAALSHKYARFPLRDGSLLKEGTCADVAVFDPATIAPD